MKYEEIDAQHLAARVREACLAVAVEAHENARMDGLCHEGAWECAMDAIRTLDLRAVLQEAVEDQTSSR